MAHGGLIALRTRHLQSERSTGAAVSDPFLDPAVLFLPCCDAHLILNLLDLLKDRHGVLCCLKKSAGAVVLCVGRGCEAARAVCAWSAAVASLRSLGDWPAQLAPDHARAAPLQLEAQAAARTPTLHLRAGLCGGR